MLKRSAAESACCLGFQLSANCSTWTISLWTVVIALDTNRHRHNENTIFSDFRMSVLGQDLEICDVHSGRIKWNGLGFVPRFVIRVLRTSYVPDLLYTASIHFVGRWNCKKMKFLKSTPPWTVRSYKRAASITTQYRAVWTGEWMADK
jgi:hypothetical protein